MDSCKGKRNPLGNWFFSRRMTCLVRYFISIIHDWKSSWQIIMIPSELEYRTIFNKMVQKRLIWFRRYIGIQRYRYVLARSYMTKALRWQSRSCERHFKTFNPPLVLWHLHRISKSGCVSDIIQTRVWFRLRECSLRWRLALAK